MKRSIARMITHLSRKSYVYLGSILKPYNLSAAEQPLFMAMQRHEGVTQEELTALTGVDKAATARAVKSLEKKGYLTRVQDKKDRRQNRIYPTDAAKQLRCTVKNELFRFDDLLTQGIDPQSLDIVYEALLKMEKNLLSNKSAGFKQGGEKDETSE